MKGTEDGGWAGGCPGPLTHLTSGRELLLLLTQENTLVVDCETNGRVEPVEVAGYSLQPRELAFHRMCRPTQPVSAGAYAVHGIHPTLYADASSWPEVREVLLESFGTGVVAIAWRAAFDRAAMSGLPWRWVDPAPWVAAQLGVLPTEHLHLADACDALEVVPGLHRAAGDARALCEVLVALFEKTQPGAPRSRP